MEPSTRWKYAIRKPRYSSTGRKRPKRVCRFRKASVSHLATPITMHISRRVPGLRGYLLKTTLIANSQRLFHSVIVFHCLPQTTHILGSLDYTSLAHLFPM